VKHYLLVFDRPESRIIEIKEYTNSSDALTARFDLEKSLGRDPDIEVVVLGADSLDNLHRTHSRYFNRPIELASKGIDRLQAVAKAQEEQTKRFRFWRRPTLAAR